MLGDAYKAGSLAALERFGIKEAGWAGDTAGFMRRQLVGEPITAAKQLAAGTIGKPGGLLHGMLWPTVPKDNWFGRKFPYVNPNKLFPWMQRANTLFTGYQMMNDALGKSGDPNEGRLTNMLTTAGTGLGAAIGYPVGGMIGGGLLTSGGAWLGKHLGRALGSRAAAPAYQPPDPYADYAQGGYYPQLGAYPQ
jgi:hypothetical protein